eukprot:gene26013-29382_t
MFNCDCPRREVACVSVYSCSECLRYLREKCPWDPRIVDNFARSLSKDSTCLNYYLEQACLADESTMLLAVHSLEKLQVLHQYGCPWGKRTLHAIALAGELENTTVLVVKIWFWPPRCICHCAAPTHRLPKIRTYARRALGC